MEFRIRGGGISPIEMDRYRELIEENYPDLNIIQMSFDISGDSISISCNNGEIAFEPIQRMMQFDESIEYMM